MDSKMINKLTSLMATILLSSLSCSIILATTIEDEIHNTVLQVELGVDYNRDGKIEFASEDNPFKPTIDTVSNDSPYVFWINDDDDKHFCINYINALPCMFNLKRIIITISYEIKKVVGINRHRKKVN